MQTAESSGSIPGYAQKCSAWAYYHERTAAKGVRTPTYADVAQPLYQRAVGRWRNYEKYLAPHLDILRPWWHAFGYE